MTVTDLSPAAATTRTVEQRFNTAVARARATGTHVTVNAMSCCRGCLTARDLGLHADADLGAQPIAYTFGGQDLELVFAGGQPFYIDAVDDGCRCTADEYEQPDSDDPDSDDEPVLVSEGEDCDLCLGTRTRRTRPADVVCFDFTRITAGQAVRDAFDAEGFDVAWDGTTSNSVTVKMG